MPKSSKIQPFEWLTSPESIGGFVREYVLADANESNGNSSETDGARCLQPTAMHIGCGSSTVGEYLVRELGFKKVVNVDRDRETLEGMSQRWFDMTNKTKGDDEKDESYETKEPLVFTSGASTNTSENDNAMEFWCLDYTSQNLPGHYSDSFDLVVDKSTLDCTLCSDCSATAAFLSEIYRTLAANNGIYLVISFHELDLILPLLRDLPGANWKVLHTTMERQVECLNTSSDGSIILTPKSLQKNILAVDCDNDGENMVSRKPLNVLIARKFPVCETEIGENNSPLTSSPSMELVFDDVVKHVQEVNDRWFRDEQPLLTNQRIEDLKAAFSGDDEKPHFKHMDLEEAYLAIFTDAEREHLTYEHFLEDWDAFCQEEEQQLEGQKTAIMTYDIALSFLKANQ